MSYLELRRLFEARYSLEEIWYYIPCIDLDIFYCDCPECQCICSYSHCFKFVTIPNHRIKLRSYCCATNTLTWKQININQCLTDTLNHCLTNALFFHKNKNLDFDKKIKSKLRANPGLLAILKISERSQVVTYVVLHVD